MYAISNFSLAVTTKMEEYVLLSKTEITENYINEYFME